MLLIDAVGPNPQCHVSIDVRIEIAKRRFGLKDSAAVVLCGKFSAKLPIELECHWRLVALVDEHGG